jgi:hypothetical protein
MTLMKQSYRSIHLDEEHFTHYWDELREYRAWELVPVDAPYGSEEAMIVGELGKRVDVIEAERDAVRRKVKELKANAIDAKTQDLQEVGTNRYTSSLDTKEKDIKARRPDGTSAARALRKLRQDRPDIHARVLSGELSPHAGMVEAGFRKKAKSRKQTGFDRLRKAWEKANVEERRAFLDEVQSYRRRGGQRA